MTVSSAFTSVTSALEVNF